MIIKGAYATDVGSYRAINEDAILLKQYEADSNTFVLGIICDGIGGTEHGEIASSMVAEKAECWFDSVCQWIDLKNVDEEILYSHFLDAVEECNRIVYQRINEQNVDTGTTLSVIMIIDNHYYICHVGDSRIYKYNNGKELELLTQDQIILKQHGEKMKSYLTNYVGKEYELSYCEYDNIIESGDLFLFCSDGFYHFLEEQDMEYIYGNLDNLEDIIQEKIKEMIQRGEKDNISCGLIFCV